jgi:hypothetical protein
MKNLLGDPTNVQEGTRYYRLNSIMLFMGYKGTRGYMVL